MENSAPYRAEVVGTAPVRAGPHAMQRSNVCFRPMADISRWEKTGLNGTRHRGKEPKSVPQKGVAMDMRPGLASDTDVWP